MNDRISAFGWMALLWMGLAGCAQPQVDARPRTPAVALRPAAEAVLNQPRPGLFTAGQPAESDWRAIAARGVTTVVNLRPDAEMQGRDEAAEVRAAGMAYVRIPIADGADLTRENARKLHETILGAGGAPVLVHCASANRAGGLLALMAASQEGMDKEAALEFGRDAGMKSTEARVREVLSQD